MGPQGARPSRGLIFAIERFKHSAVGGTALVFGAVAAIAAVAGRGSPRHEPVRVRRGPGDPRRSARRPLAAEVRAEGRPSMRETVSALIPVDLPRGIQRGRTNSARATRSINRQVYGIAENRRSILGLFGGKRD
jgi:hypothetical protein